MKNGNQKEQPYFKQEDAHLSDLLLGEVSKKYLQL